MNTPAKPPVVACVVVAAGRGLRAMANDSVPKQYQRIGGVPVLTRTLAALTSHPGIGPIVVVIHPADASAYEAATRHFGVRLLAPAHGGATRQESVRNGLDALAHLSPERVLIHDAARPFVSIELIDRVIAALEHRAGAIPSLAVSDTLKRTSAGMVVGGTVARNGLYRAQTPQGFRFRDIVEAHKAAALAGMSEFTDDAAVAEWHGIRVALIEGEEGNRKLTTVADIREADSEFRDGAHPGQARRSSLARVAHRLGKGDHVVLFGTRVAHSRALVGAASVDLGARVVIDALLGALAPDNASIDDRGEISLSDVARRVHDTGGGIMSVDVTIIGAGLAIEPHRETMRTALAAILGVHPARVGIASGRAESVGLVHRHDELSILANAVINVPVAGPGVATPGDAAQGDSPPATPESTRGGNVERASAAASHAVPRRSSATDALLDRIASPADVRALSDDQLPQLAAELRGKRSTPSPSQAVISAPASASSNLPSRCIRSSTRHATG